MKFNKENSSSNKSGSISTDGKKISNNKSNQLDFNLTQANSVKQLNFSTKSTGLKSNKNYSIRSNSNLSNNGKQIKNQECDLEKNVR